VAAGVTATPLSPVLAPTPTPPVAVALAYLQALQTQQWKEMWRLLHPQAQRQWPNEQAFAAFLSHKFAPGGTSTIATVSVGAPQQLANWNHIAPPYAIYVGQRLRVMPPGARAPSPIRVLACGGRPCHHQCNSDQSWRIGPAPAINPACVNLCQAGHCIGLGLPEENYCTSSICRSQEARG